MKGVACRPGTLNRAVALRQTGMLRDDIAIKLGIASSTVSKLWRRAGLPPSNGTPKADRDKAVDAVRGGASLREAAALIGASNRAVLTWCRSAGVACAYAQVGDDSDKSRSAFRTPHKDEWPQERSGRLIQLWADGTSAAEIGRRLGVTKNAVIGRVRRLGLERRASPIKPMTAEQRQVKKKADPRGKWIAPKKVKAPIVPRVVLRPALSPILAIATPAPISPNTIQLMDFPPEQPERGRPTRCTYAEGEKRQWRYCHDAVAPGSSWCAGHRYRHVERRAA